MASWADANNVKKIIMLHNKSDIRKKSFLVINKKIIMIYPFFLKILRISIE